MLFAAVGAGSFCISIGGTNTGADTGAAAAPVAEVPVLPAALSTEALDGGGPAVMTAGAV